MSLSRLSIRVSQLKTGGASSQRRFGTRSSSSSVGPAYIEAENQSSKLRRDTFRSRQRSE